MNGCLFPYSQAPTISTAKGRPTKAELQHGHVLDRRSQARLREIEVETEALARRILQLRPTTAHL